MSAVIIDGFTYNFGLSRPRNSDRSYQYVLSRLLIGSLSFRFSDRNVLQKIDHSKMPSAPQLLPPGKAFSKFMSDYMLAGDSAKFIGVTSADNRAFFQDVLSEFSNYFYHSSRGGNTSAFVFIYRILERCSYSVPLLYTALARDFVGTFNSLKDQLSEEKMGELGLFKKFINEGKFIDAAILDSEFTIKFSSSYDLEENYISVINKNFGSKCQMIDIAGRQFTVKFRDVIELLIVVRNRFFHFGTGAGKNNIRSVSVINSDEFFSALNKVFASFMAVVVLKIISHHYRYILY